MKIPEMWNTLGRENPPWEAVRPYFENLAPEQADALLRQVERYVTEEEEAVTTGAAAGDDADEWRTTHAIRILAHRRDRRLLPLGARLMQALAFQYDYVLANTLLNAFEVMTTPENFEFFWAEYERCLQEGEQGEDEDQIYVAYDYLTFAAESDPARPEVRSALLSWFESDPVRAAWAIESTLNPAYLPALEAHLERIAPFMKYLSLDRGSVPEHDEWIEVGSAWVRLLRAKENRLTQDDRDLLERKPIAPETFYTARKPLRAVGGRNADDEAAVQAEHAELERRFLSRLPEYPLAVDALTGKRVLEILPLQPADRIRLKRAIAEQAGKGAMKSGIRAADHSSRPSVSGRNDPCSCGSGRKFKKCCGG